MRGEDLSRYSNKIIESLGSRKCRSMIVVRVSVGDAADLESQGTVYACWIGHKTELKEYLLVSHNPTWSQGTM